MNSKVFEKVLIRSKDLKYTELKIVGSSVESVIINASLERERIPVCGRRRSRFELERDWMGVVSIIQQQGAIGDYGARRGKNIAALVDLTE